MATWFYAPDFKFSPAPSNYPDGRNVPAYYAIFESIERPYYTVRLCMLHDNELAQFPYRYVVSEAIAVLYAAKNGLKLRNKPTSGFISREDAWVIYNCERPKWDKFQEHQVWRLRRPASNTPPWGMTLVPARERSRSPVREERIRRNVVRRRRPRGTWSE